MGRPSKLTDAQWDEIERRMLAGETASSLAREYKVTEGAIRNRKRATVETMKTVSNQIVAVEQALKKMPLTTRENTRNYAARLLAIGDTYYDVTEMATATAYKLHTIANIASRKIDEVDPFTSEGQDLLKGIAFVVKAGNDALNPANTLLKANEDRVIQETAKGEVIEADVKEIIGMDVRDAAKAYQDFIQN